MKKQVLTAIITAAILAGGSLGAFAAEMEIGEKYQETENAAEKSKTEEAYAARPVQLKQAEDLGRGLTAVPAEQGGVLVTWRLLGTESVDTHWDLYKNDSLLKADVSLTNYFDKDGKSGDRYAIAPKGTTDYEDTATAWNQAYLSIPVKQYDNCKYNIDDISVGDVDGDGEYELIVRRIPEDYFNQVYMDETTKQPVDNRTGYPLIEAYDMDGSHLWTIDIGQNEVNDIDVNFLVYDFDGDGKAEIAMRTVDGTIDGAGNVIGEKDKSYLSSLQQFKDRHYLSKGNEFLSIFDGQTGAEVSRSKLYPERDPLSSWATAYKDDGRLTKRASHYLLSTAYLDGEKPSIVFLRGAWDAVKIAAYDYDGSKIEKRWEYDSGADSTADNLYNAGYHSMAVADVDFDGKDEILSGAGALDDNGTFLYATQAEGTKLGHGDAFDVAMMDPSFHGYYVWACHETKDLPANIDLHDARTGQVLYGFQKPKDTGRSRAADIDPTNPGWEMWGSTGTPLMSLKGEILAEPWNQFPYRNPDGTDVKDESGNSLVSSLPMNFKVQWDGDLLSEFLDGVTVSKYNWTDKSVDIIMENKNCGSNGGTKAVPSLCADILGDWREEILWRDAENKNILIYSTNIETEYKMPTLMHDITYREAAAWQNNHYNQPTNTSFYLGNETTEVPIPEIKTAKGAVNPAYQNQTQTHQTMKIKEEATPATPAATEPPAATAVPCRFQDIDNIAAKNDIIAMYQKGIIQGVSDTEFQPDSGVTVAQFIKMMTVAAGIPKEAATAEYWAAPYVEAAKKAGIVHNNIAVDRVSDLEREMTREEMASIIAKCIDYKQIASIEIAIIFQDENQISDWAKQDVQKAAVCGIIQGDENSCFHPGDGAKRSEAASMLSRFVDLLEKK